MDHEIDTSARHVNATVCNDAYFLVYVEDGPMIYVSCAMLHKLLAPVYTLTELWLAQI